MRPILYLIVFITFFFVNCKECKAWKRGLRFPGYKVPNWVPTTEMPWKSKIYCLARCALSSNCTGLFYNENTKQCLQFYVNYFEFWIGTTDGNIVLFDQMKVVMITDGPTPPYDLAGASTICISLGGRLVTLGEMTTMWQDGLELCSCGWVADGQNVMPKQNSCGDQPELKNCGMTLAYAYCVFT